MAEITPAFTSEQWAEREAQMEAQRLADLGEQLEELLAAVWGAEEEWRFDDRLDCALKQGPRK